MAHATAAPAAFSASTTPAKRPGASLPMPIRTLAGFVAAVLAVVAIGFFSYQSLVQRSETADAMTHSLQVMERLQGLLSTLKDAETGQRGYLLTGDEAYLQPYDAAKADLAAQLQTLRGLAADRPQQRQQLDLVEQVAAQKIQELGETVALRRLGDQKGALALTLTNRGKDVMDRLRVLVENLMSDERALYADRQRAWQDAAKFSLAVTWGGSALLLVLIAAAGFLAAADYRARETLAWIRTGQMALSQHIQGEQRLEALGDRVLAFLADYLDAQVGTVYITLPDDSLRRVAAYAVEPGAPHEVLQPGESLLGQAAKAGRPLHVRDVPAGYLQASSSTGRGVLRELVVVPARADGGVQAVVELGFFRPVGSAELDLLERVCEMLGVAMRSSRDRTRLEELLDETQRQAEELQAQQEELRVSNEELEEQGRALRESQTDLQAQQAELEQTNVQLEDQTRLLELQKDHLERSQVELAGKATELERSNQYKSEFLANMSHELRTPLNSSLILAKLLADNKEGNLTEAQIKFAQTIYSAGNDLLALINDILDLAKIESGKVELAVEASPVGRLVETIVAGIQPLARQKGLKLLSTVAPELPLQIETDLQRLSQILRNLLSNAVKFTERGEVALHVKPAPGGRLAFEVHDTGIGIPAHQQGIIFDAFRQADGSTHRKYGGTGLGLSISRDLARLLGGDVTVSSVPGQGSVFTLVLPAVYGGPAAGAAGSAVLVAAADAAVVDPQSVAAAPYAPLLPMPGQPGAQADELAPIALDDDRDRVTAEDRSILVVEDDPAFAAILRDLARETGFLCVVTHTAGDGLVAARRFKPSAILLDIGLPDHSGLGVLDRLKRDPQTRHVPVHVISATDYTHEALELGAIGYALKPVKREQLQEAIGRLESKISQSMRRVLVIEDDERQRESIRQLLGTGEVEIVGVATAGEALARLKSMTFDCMVMDLNLPDMSGYQLLEQMSGQEDVAFPPVIVYTGRSLTRAEEQQLRRFSRSIIIKGARSPERLLDEVTLFIHQVESKLTPDRQRMLKAARERDAVLEGRRILVVEDDVRNIFALSSLLEPHGVKVEIARNGREAIETLARPEGGAIDLVLMDIMMPEMDGYAAMREIRKRSEWARLPIIALTAKAMRDDRDKSLEAGANDYIAKPLDVEKLLSLVRVWMPK